MEYDKLPNRKDRDGAAGRVRAVIRCKVRQGNRPWVDARLEDISLTGFKITSFRECRPELPLRIRIPGLQMLNAKVCWQEGDTSGCELDQPLHVAVFDHIVKQATGS